MSITLAAGGVAAIVAGVLLLWGLGVALMVAGGCAVVAAVALYDPSGRA